ncbi:33200_t:CDS:2, partial [Racocetra persica]
SEASLLASAFRKVTYARKPDFWFLVEVAGTMQEILFEATSGTKLRVFIMDQPGYPLCRVREVYDLKIPYRPVDEESVLQFIYSLWMTRLGLEESIKEIDEIGREIQVFEICANSIHKNDFEIKLSTNY